MKIYFHVIFKVALICLMTAYLAGCTGIMQPAQPKYTLSPTYEADVRDLRESKRKQELAEIAKKQALAPKYDESTGAALEDCAILNANYLDDGKSDAMTIAKSNSIKVQ